MTISKDRVWYVSYGSNLARERFLCYVQGGRPPGAVRTYDGCRDTTLPEDSCAWELPGRVVFAGTFYAWDPEGAGAALYFPDPAHVAIARAWLITKEQFADVVAAENKFEVGSFDDVVATVFSGNESSAKISDGPYGRMVACGSRDGVSAWTFTTNANFEDVTLNAPPQVYVDMLADGLVQTKGWTEGRARDYLRELAGYDAERNRLL